MDKVQKFVLNIGKKTVFAFISLIFTFLFVTCVLCSCQISYVDEHIFYLKDYPSIMLPGLVIMCVLLIVLYRKVPGTFWEKVFCPSFFSTITVLWFAVALWFLHETILYPVYDQKWVMEAAGDLLHGNYDAWKPGIYMYNFPYQSGLVLLYVPFHFFFGKNVVAAIEVFNLLCWYFSILGITKLAKEYFGIVEAKITYLTLLAFIPMWGYVTFLYGTLPSMVCVVWGIVFFQKFIQSERLYDFVILTIFFVLAVAAKTNSEIFVLAAAIMMVAFAVKKKDMRYVLCAALLMAALYAYSHGILWVMHWITGEDTFNGIPFSIYFAIGLQESNIAPGWYSEYGVDLYRRLGWNHDAVLAASTQEILDKLSLYTTDVQYGLRFFFRKVIAEWNIPDFEGMTLVNRKNFSATLSYSMKDFLYNGGIRNTLYFMFYDVYQTVYNFGLILYLIYERKKLEYEKMLPLVSLIGGFLCHIVWEGKGQYVVAFYLLMTPYLVRGYTQFIISVAAHFQNSRDKCVKKILSIKEIYVVGLIFALVVSIRMAPGGFFDNTFEVGKDTADYIWFCQNQEQWKKTDYKRSLIYTYEMSEEDMAEMKEELENKASDDEQQSDWHYVKYQRN